MKSPGRPVVLVGDSQWRGAGVSLGELRRAANLTLLRSRAAPGCGSLTILLTGDAQLRALNRSFRGKSVPTNVLAFPAARGAKDYLGDVAIGLGVARREAAAAAKPLRNHVAHLAVHGVLHLLGYDHGSAREACVMEPLETAILGEMGIPDPYARAAAAE